MSASSLTSAELTVALVWHPPGLRGVARAAFGHGAGAADQSNGPTCSRPGLHLPSPAHPRALVRRDSSRDPCAHQGAIAAPDGSTRVAEQWTGASLGASRLPVFGWPLRHRLQGGGMCQETLREASPTEADRRGVNAVTHAGSRARRNAGTGRQIERRYRSDLKITWRSAALAKRRPVNVDCTRPECCQRRGSCCCRARPNTSGTACKTWIYLSGSGLSRQSHGT
jgi:hypothetical protein